MFVALLFCFCFQLSRVRLLPALPLWGRPWPPAPRGPGRFAHPQPCDSHITLWTLLQRGKGMVEVGEMEQGACWAQAVGWGWWFVQRPRSQAGPVGGCRSAEHGSGVACQAPSASLPLGSVRPITNSQSLFSAQTGPSKSWEPFWFWFYFFNALLKKMKAERTMLKSQADNCF